MIRILVIINEIPVRAYIMIMNDGAGGRREGVNRVHCTCAALWAIKRYNKYIYT